MEINRVNRSKTTARRAYDHMSRFYDLMAGWSETPLMHRGLKILAIQKGDSVLDIGCGTGRAMIDMCAQVGKSGSVYGIDLSPGMLKQARRRWIHAMAPCMVSLIEGDGSSLPYCEASFNKVFISFTLELFDTPEIPMVLQECRRVLKPGGRLGVVSLAKTEPLGSLVRLYEWFHAKMPAVVDCRPIYSREAIRKAGFTVEKSGVFSMWGLPVDVVAAGKA